MKKVLVGLFFYFYFVFLPVNWAYMAFGFPSLHTTIVSAFLGLIFIFTQLYVPFKTFKVSIANLFFLTLFCFWFLVFLIEICGNKNYFLFSDILSSLQYFLFVLILFFVGQSSELWELLGNNKRLLFFSWIFVFISFVMLVIWQKNFDLRYLGKVSNFVDHLSYQRIGDHIAIFSLIVLTFSGHYWKKVVVGGGHYLFCIAWEEGVHLHFLL